MSKGKEKTGGTLRDMVAGVFTGTAAPVKKTYSQIVAKFNETREELKELITDSDTQIAEIDGKIAELNTEKEVAASEKSNALTTLDFLDKFVK